MVTDPGKLYLGLGAPYVPKAMPTSAAGRTG